MILNFILKKYDKYNKYNGNFEFFTFRAKTSL